MYMNWIDGQTKGFTETAQQEGFLYMNICMYVSVSVLSQGILGLKALASQVNKRDIFICTYFCTDSCTDSVPENSMTR